MTKEKILKEAKDHLEYTHDSLRRAFRSAPGAEQVFINVSLEEIEKAVKQIEALEGLLPLWKATKNKKNLETITEE